jgi:hypothetical protein
MQRPELANLRLHVLHLHKALIDDARIQIERVDGRLTAHQFWDRLISDPALGWLGPLTALIVAMDEWLDDADATTADAAALAAEVARLLMPADDGDPFQRRYAELLQRDPAIVMAHAAARRALPRGR